MQTIHTEIEINASLVRIWDILTDFPAFPAWNPFVKRIDGRPVVGQHLRVAIQPQGSKGMNFAPTVLEATPNKEPRWIGRLLLPGVFDGEHAFRMEALGADRTRFIHEEKFRGLLVPLFAQSLESGSQAGFVAMNQALGLDEEVVQEAMEVLQTYVDSQQPCPQQ